MAIVRVQSAPFDPTAEIHALSGEKDDTGGLVTFQGLVRATDKSRRIESLTLEHYPGMTEHVLQNIADTAESRFSLHRCLVIHRYGRMLPGETIVLVATASAHRKAAFDGACYIMDRLKTDVPFWKFEESNDGRGHWVEAKLSDSKAAERWQT